VPVIIERGDAPDIIRVSTGLWSLDKALSSLNGTGMPLRTIYEIYGREGNGKSTLAYYMAGKVKPTGVVLLGDLEATADMDYVGRAIGQSGFDGTIRSIDMAEEKKGKKMPRPHEDIATELANGLLNNTVNAVILDSLGALTPIMEAAGDFEEAFVGQRAKVIAKITRRLAAYLRISDEPKAAFYVNHVLNPIGGRGHYTPGGDVKNFHSNVRMWLYRLETFDNGTFIAEAKIEKLKYGGTSKEKKGLVCFVPDLGVSPELTALFDCVNTGIASRGTTIKMDVLDKKTGEKKARSFGYISKLLEAARDPNEAKQFRPFFERLEYV
jgi:RecA/RadA recombinase